MERTTAPGATSDNRFTDGDESQGLPASVVDAKWLNDVQEEVAGAIEGYNTQLDASKPNQLLGVLQSISSAITTAKNQVSQAFQQADSQLSTTLTRNINNGDAALGRRIDSEATTRSSADNGLSGRINSEASTRGNADNGLGNRIDDVINSKIPDAILAAKKALFPVGSIYCNYSSGTNPSSLLGFGSWAKIDQGFLLSQNSYSGAAGTTGGSRTTGVSVPNTGWGISGDSGTPGGAGKLLVASGNAELNEYLESVRQSGGSRTINNISIMPPSVTVYMWRRTA